MDVDQATSKEDHGKASINGKEHQAGGFYPVLGRLWSIASVRNSMLLQASVVFLLSAILALLVREEWTPKVEVQSCELPGGSDCQQCFPLAANPKLSNSARDHLELCSGNGHYVLANQKQATSELGACHCHACFSGVKCTELDSNCFLNLFHGDPVMFEHYWLKEPQAPTVIPSWQGMSYFPHRSNAYMFVDYHLEQTIRALHAMVGNAVTEGRYIVVGVGSTQLYQAALYALASQDSYEPTSVVSAIPHYSSFEGVTRYLDSRKFEWVGDAYKFHQTAAKEPYIELVTLPNNPCGSIRKSVVNGTGSVMHDLAYYWPHYVPISALADYPIMLWTLSKITGHAGTRLGWAIVEDESVASKMTVFIRHNTVGVSQDSQSRAVTVLRTIMSSYTQVKGVKPERQPFFHYFQAVLEDRWRRTQQALHNSNRLVLQEHEPSFCTFLKKSFKPNPAFLWLMCKAEEDCSQLLQENRIKARDGPAFGGVLTICTSEHAGQACFV